MGGTASDAPIGGGTNHPAIERFAAKCSHDPVTGCVIWSGSTTRGAGGDYGKFWFEGKSWQAQRWAAKYIHGQEIDGRAVSASCQNSLCQQHLIAKVVASENDFRYNWVLVSVGVRQLPPKEEREDDGVPFHNPPEWLAPFVTKETTDDCPF